MLKELMNSVNQELGTSDWLEITQDRIQAFADCTGDHQWIHVDADRASQEMPNGKTIAHGFLTLSLLSFFQEQIGILSDPSIHNGFNYGLDRVRFISPVQEGSRIRNRIKLISVTEKAPKQILIKVENTVDIEGQDKPAMIAESLALLILK